MDAGESDDLTLLHGDTMSSSSTLPSAVDEFPMLASESLHPAAKCVLPVKPYGPLRECRHVVNRVLDAVGGDEQGN